MKTKKILGLISVFLIIMALILKTAEVTDAGISSLKLCAHSVIPTLFPFFVLSGILVNTGLISLLGKFLEPISKKLFKVSGKGAVVFVMGILCGYPTGAIVTADLYKQKKISKKEGERLIAFCNNSGPLFVIGSVGYGMLNDRNIGIILYVIHAVSAVLVGILFSLFSKESNNVYSNDYISINLGKAMSKSVENAVKSILNVCGYVVFFGCIGAIVKTIIPNVFINALLEVTTGAKSLIDSGLDINKMLILLSGIIGFGGICVLLQVQGAVGDLGISVRLYILGKTLQMIISMCIIGCYLYFNRDICVFSQQNSTNFYTNEVSFLMLFMFFLCAFLMLCKLTKKN